VIVVVVDSSASPRPEFDDKDDDPSASLRAGYDDEHSLRGLP